MAVLAAADYVLFFDVGFEVVSYSLFEVVPLFDQISNREDVFKTMSELKVTLIDQLLQIGVHFMVRVDCFQLSELSFVVCSSWCKVKALMDASQRFLIELLQEPL